MIQLDSIVRYQSYYFTDIRYGISSNMVVFADRMYYGWVTALKFGTPNESVVGAEVTCLSSLMEGYKNYSWDLRDLMEIDISLAQATAYQTSIDVQFNSTINLSRKPTIRKTELQENVNNLMKLKEPFDSIDYSKPNIEMKIVDTYMCKIIRVNERVYKEKQYRFTDSCKLFGPEACPHDLIISIPQDWVNYQGYSETIIRRWLLFINDLGLVTKGVYIGNKPRPDHQPYDPTTISSAFLRTNLYHEILIEVSEYPVLNYVYFLLLRYLYFSVYNNIPGLCLQLRDNTALTGWQTLMLVHSTRLYPSRYGLVHCEMRGNEEVTIPDILSQNNIRENLLKNMRKSHHVNYSFTYVTINKAYHDKLPPLIVNRDWRAISKWLSEVEDNKIIKPEIKEQASFRGNEEGHLGAGTYLVNHNFTVDSSAPPIFFSSTEDTEEISDEDEYSEEPYDEEDAPEL